MSLAGKTKLPSLPQQTALHPGLGEFEGARGASENTFEGVLLIRES
jgi:hypothetical protein